MTTLIITPADIEIHRYYLDSRLRDLKFYRTILDSTEDKNVVEPSYDSLLDFFCMQKAVYTKLSENFSKIFPDNGDIESNSCNQVYSSYISALLSSGRLSNVNDAGAVAVAKPDFSAHELDYSRDYKSLEYRELETLEDILKEKQQSPVTVLTGFYDWVYDQAVSYASNPKCKKINEAYQKVSLKLNIGKSEKESKIQEFRGIKYFNNTNSGPHAGSSDTILSWDNIEGYPDVKKFFQQELVLVNNYELALSVASVKTIFPRGVLLYGPPGTGKTTMFNTFAHYANIPIIMTNVSEIGSSYVFGASTKLTQKFEEAIKPIKLGNSVASILFIDELDAIAPKRTSDSDGSKEYNNLVTVFNIYMDGSGYLPGLMVFGATNKRENIDPAIMSRFRKEFEMGYPNKDALKLIFNAVVKSLQIENKWEKLVDIQNIEDIVEESFNKKLVGRDFRNILENQIREEAVKLCETKINPYPIPESTIMELIRKYEKLIKN